MENERGLRSIGEAARQRARSRPQGTWGRKEHQPNCLPGQNSLQSLILTTLHTDKVSSKAHQGGCLHSEWSPCKVLLPVRSACGANWRAGLGSRSSGQGNPFK